MGKSLRDIGHKKAGLTPAQQIMRTDMLRPAPKSDPVKLSDALDESLGMLHDSPASDGPEQTPEGKFDDSVTGLALGIIHANAPDVTMSLRQWDVVQGLIEKGLRIGYQRGRSAS